LQRYVFILFLFYASELRETHKNTVQQNVMDTLLASFFFAPTLNEKFNDGKTPFSRGQGWVFGFLFK